MGPDDAAPPADVQEQRQTTLPPEVPEPPRQGPEVPEADAVEQSQPAALDEEDEPR